MVLWIFGYGSLIWTPEFQYEERVTGYIKDFKRVSTPSGCVDHDNRKGNTGSVGLRLTLHPEEGAITGGVAYRVTADVEHQILSSYLEESLQLNPRTSRVQMVEFFIGQDASDTPAPIRVMAYITPPKKSNLWHIVLQLNPVVTINDRSNKESSGSDRAQMMMRRRNDQVVADRRVSVQDHWKRDRAWFESQQHGATS